MQRANSLSTINIKRFFKNNIHINIGIIFGFIVLFLPLNLIAMEYGEDGPYYVERETIINPLSGDNVTVFLPSSINSPVPVMFFSHGYGGNYYQAYKSLCEHVASQGVAVVFSPYPSGISWSEQYDILWSGFKEAADVYDALFDFDYVGFFGHSWGGGATPNMALRGINEGWGKNGLLMFIMAPGPANGITKAEMQSLKNGYMIVQTFENDTIVPESLALGIYEDVGIPSEDKAYYYIHGGEHSEPSQRSVDDYDRLAIWKPLDALMDTAFILDNPYYAKSLALDGQGDLWNTTIIPDEDEPVDIIPEEDDPVDNTPEEDESEDSTSNTRWIDILRNRSNSSYDGSSYLRWWNR